MVLQGTPGSVKVPPVFQRQKPSLSDLSKVIRKRQDRGQNPGFWLRPENAQSRADGLTMTPSEAGLARRRPGPAGLKVLSREQAPRKWYASEQTARLAALGAGGTRIGPGRKAPRRRRPGAVRRGRAKPRGRRPAGASPASGRSQRPPQPCGPGSGPTAATCLGPELGGGAGRCDGERNAGCGSVRPGTATRAVPRSPHLLPGCGPGGERGSQQLRLPAVVWRASYSSPLVGPGGSFPARGAANTFLAPSP